MTNATTIVGPNAESSLGAVTIDYNHSQFLFLYSSNVSENEIISFQLIGVENYSMRYRSMKVALLGRNNGVS